MFWLLPPEFGFERNLSLRLESLMTAKCLFLTEQYKKYTVLSTMDRKCHQQMLMNVMLIAM